MAEQNRRVPLPPEERADASSTFEIERSTAIPDFPWTLTWCTLGLLLICLAWFPVSKLSAHYGVSYNEGFNTYLEAAAAAGNKIYGSPPVYTYANYPPVSFHLVGWLSGMSHDINLTGRWIAFLAYLAIGGLITLIVRHLTRSWHFAAYSGLCWLVWLAAFDFARIATNDPHLLGLAFSLAGLYCFLLGPESTRWLCVSAIVFAVSLFTKQSLVSIPLAVAIQLMLTSRKRLAIWVGVAAAACAVLLLLTLTMDGRYFFAHLMLPRIYSVSDIRTSFGSYLYFMQVPFVVSIVWAFRPNRIPYSGLLLMSFLIAHVVGGLYCGGAGAGVNHLFDAMILTAIITGLTLTDLPRMIERMRYPRAASTFLLIVPFFLTSLWAVTQRLPADISRNPNETAQFEAEYTGVSDFIKAQPGRALCETLLLCYVAGKADMYDAFEVDQLIRTGALPQEQVLQLIAQRQFAIIEIDWNLNERIQPSPRGRFSGPIMNAIFSNYQLVLRSANYAVFKPRH